MHPILVWRQSAAVAAAATFSLSWILNSFILGKLNQMFVLNLACINKTQILFLEHSTLCICM